MPAVIGFAGYSDSGKTTLITRLVPLLKQAGLKVAVLKHDAHGHYKEVAGTDSMRLAEAGADEVWTLSPDSVHMYRRTAEPLPEKLIGEELQAMDLVLIEGFKHGSHRKIAVFRLAEQSRIVGELAPAPVAIAAGTPFVCGDTPVFALDDAEGLARFLIAQAGAWQD
ncbi:molybdopterin-guanine dinucleotide biosynthesis protein B [Paenibacillus athensensis]|uniref:Molybdopterin-guanine dinucleotide biosynthesis protein B n=1 Tax=Paenibacillus athensensis TaxID=1967502 RepID=A0A4Y8Q9W6_9BACL|nr:molybdopterin-guanine dinucleotide biosynthesis protein B [Paenibacillus athensensis]MCD1259085.1 molybdopterin-guanine dinucleotide biosynthesis protein B [Paenibacillus athensensis]